MQKMLVDYQLFANSIISISKFIFGTVAARCCGLFVNTNPINFGWYTNKESFCPSVNERVIGCGAHVRMRRGKKPYQYEDDEDVPVHRWEIFSSKIVILRIPRRNEAIYEPRLQYAFSRTDEYHINSCLLCGDISHRIIIYS
jgi:hypothetical protein